MQSQKNQKQKGNQQFKKKNFVQAIKHYTNYIKQQHTDNIQALLNMAFCHYKLQQYQTAITVCDQVLTIDDKYYKCYYRRAMCRKEIIKDNKDNFIEKYKLYYDCKMFNKCSDSKEFSKQQEELALLVKNLYTQMMLNQPTKLSVFQRNLLEIEKDNINSFALSWLQKKFHKEQVQTIKNKIDFLYKQMIKVNRTIKDKQQRQTMIEHIRNKINALKLESKNNLEQKSCKQQKDEKEQKNPTISTANETNQEQTVSQVLSPLQLPKQIDDNQIQTKQQPQATSEKEQQNNENQNFKKVSNQEQTKNQQPKIKQKVNSIQQNTLAKSNLSPPPTVLNTNLNKKDNISNMTAQQLFIKYFKEQLNNSRDVFQQFAQNLINLINQKTVSNLVKEQLLTIIIKDFKNLKLTLKGISKANKTKLKETFITNQVKENIWTTFVPK